MKMRVLLVHVIPVVVLVSIGGKAQFPAPDFHKQVIYQIVTDRFSDGDKSNNDPAVSPGLYDGSHSNWWAYWGGNFKGIEDHLPYLTRLGVTAIWISPPVDNINVSVPGPAGKPWMPYHGYWARDLKRIEEHFADSPDGWEAFDRLVRACHRSGIRVIVDFAPNHSNPRNAGEFGVLYDNGVLLGSYRDDPQRLFHHTPNVQDWDDRYQIQYDTIFDLADLDQENPVVDAYLKAAVAQFLDHGVDGFRLDAIKHVTWGWLPSLADTIYARGPVFLAGEWFQGSIRDSLYRDSCKLSNTSRIPLLDFPLAFAVREVFTGKAGFDVVDKVLRAEEKDFVLANDLVTFVDNHDLPRLLSLTSRSDRLDEALAFVLTCRGIPTVYYGDEQYLHNDTNGGGDPYCRPLMSLWRTDTRPYRLIRALARLRLENDALAYGSMRARWLGADAFVFEREFAHDAVLVAINRNDNTSVRLTGVKTRLPEGQYPDFLHGLLRGTALRVIAGHAGRRDNTIPSLRLPPRSVSVWPVTGAADGPALAAVEPPLSRPGARAEIFGAGFSDAPGQVALGSAKAEVESWKDTKIVFDVPSIAGGEYPLHVRTAAGRETGDFPLRVLSGLEIPVRFTVKNVPSAKPGDAVFFSGNTVELGQWSLSRDAAPGPMLSPNPPDWFMCVSVPAGKTIEFKFFTLSSDSKVTQESGPAHSYLVPERGTGKVTVSWRP